MPQEERLEGIPKPWIKFLARLESEYKTVQVVEWKAIHLLSHVLKRYEELYKLKYALPIKGAPSKCSEMFMMNKLFIMLNTIDARKVKEYIDWVFEKKIIPRRMKITKLSLFIAPGVTNEFLQQVKKTNTITRSSVVQAAYKEIANELGLEIETYGDLAFILKAIDRDMAKEDIDKVKKSSGYILIKNLEMVGLNLDTLRKLES